MGSAPPSVKSEKFYFGIEKADEATVTVRGTVSIEDPKPLNKLVEELHAYLLSRKYRRVNVDVRQLEFMNSTGFKPLVLWLERIMGCPESSRYTLHFLSAPARKWQPVFLSALSCFAPTQVTIETAAPK